MKYTNEIEIKLPRTKVVELFDNPDNLKHWQPGFISFEHISGIEGQPGSMSRIKMKNGNRIIEMTETLHKRDLPHELSGQYKMKGTIHKLKNFFVELENGNTKWISEGEFIFSGIVMKFFGFIMPRAFQKQSFKYMEYFRDFAEAHEEE